MKMSDSVKTLSDLPEVELIFERTNDFALLPVKSTKQAVGFDLCAVIPGNKTITIEPGCLEAIGVGFKVSMPNYLELQIRSRSGLAFKNQIFVMNSPGTIDPDYQDEIKVLLFNAGKKPFEVVTGNRIAQAVVGFVANAKLVEGKLQDVDSDRIGGLGSTGV
jgi:dUTP pyrophosphatase